MLLWYFSYGIVLIFFRHIYGVLFLLFVVFVLYAIWDFFKTIEYRREFWSKGFGLNLMSGNVPTHAGLQTVVQAIQD